MDMYQARDLAIVHATGSTDPSRSHFDAMQFMEYGTPGNKNTPNGWIGRHLEAAAWANESPFRAVGMGAMPARPANVSKRAPMRIPRRITSARLRVMRLARVLSRLGWLGVWASWVSGPYMLGVWFSWATAGAWGISRWLL